MLTVKGAASTKAIQIVDPTQEDLNFTFILSPHDKIKVLRNSRNSSTVLTELHCHNMFHAYFWLLYPELLLNPSMA